MKGWRQALYVFLICLPALLIVATGAVLVAREVPGAIRYEPRRVTNLYRDVAEDLSTNGVAALSVTRQKGWRQRGKVNGVPWGYVVHGAKTTVWLQDGKGLCRTHEVATVDPFPFALVFYGGGSLVAVALLLLSVLLACGFLRYLRARDDFLAATAHDLTTPLVGMRMAIGRSDEEAKNLVERMLLLVGNLKDFLKLGGRRRPPELKPTDLVARTKEAYSLFAADYADSEGGEVEISDSGFQISDAEARLSDGEGRQMVLADETMLMQILWNVFGNDLKYAAPYGKVAVRFRREGSRAVVEFVDEGQGMTPYQMRHAFDRYYRAKTVLESGKGGFGIGLCTARDFARAMGGELSVRANDPKGCVFSLALPSALPELRKKGKLSDMKNSLITVALAVALAAAGRTAAGVTERIELKDGWWHTANELKWRGFTYDRMAGWLDDMGRELMSDPGPSRRPPRDPQHPFAAADYRPNAGQGWTRVRLPHDRALDRGFDYDRSASDGCVEPGVQGWYRRTLEIPASAAGRRVFFESDGAASFSLVWINGRFVGGWPYAYTPWRVELTPYVDFGGTNVLAVRTAFVRDAARYYVGAGLCRPCHLAICDRDHLVPGSVAIRTALDGDVAHVTATYAMSESGARTKTFDVAHPRRWDVNDPHLYEVEIEGERFRYGIRTIGFHPDARGFRLNGRTVPIRGVCLHQDLDVLGAVWNRGAWERRLRKLKEAGVNAVRMSHYRHPAGLYDLCDELGLIVMDEVFDQWTGAFNENDYHRLFDRWHERDLRAAIRANRNHPCIVLWGVGNEIVEQRGDMGQLDLGLFARLGRELTAIAHEEDPTRPVTTANNNGGACLSDEVDFVDVYGFNYCCGQIAAYRAARPSKPTITTETGCYLATRGEYYFGLKSPRDCRDLRVSSYLEGALRKMEEEWTAHAETPSHAGGFYWTGFDYLGGPGATPRMRAVAASVDPARRDEMKREIAEHGLVRASVRACPTGLFDLAGFPRDVYWQFKARWCPDEPTVHLLPHWNWPERVGQKTPVVAFTSGDEVELFVNGVSQGRRTVPLAGARTVWPDVVYRPGAISAVAYRKGVRWAETKVETTGPVARLVLRPEAESVAADGDTVAYVNVDALDAEGRVVPRTRLKVAVDVSGGGELVGAENGDETDLTGFRTREHVVFNGHLSLVVRARPGTREPVRVCLRSDELPPVACEIPIEVIAKLSAVPSRSPRLAR